MHVEKLTKWKIHTVLAAFFSYLKFIYRLQIIILEIKNDNLGLLTASKKIDTVDNHDLYYVK